MEFWLNLYLSKQYGARRLLSEFPDKGWKLGSIDSLLKRICKTDKNWLSGNQEAVDRIRRVAVEDLMLSQEDKPKGTNHRVRFRRKLPFSVQVYTG